MFKYIFIISNFLSFILSQNSQICHKTDLVLRRRKVNFFCRLHFLSPDADESHQYNLWHDLNN